MNATQTQLLKAIRRHRRGCTLSQLMVVCSRSRSSLYGRLRILEQEGLVEGAEVEKDGPPGWQWLWTLTTEGVKALR